MIIVHLLLEHEWERAAHRGRIAPASLSTDGFVHCSTPAQVAGTVERHFPTTRGLLVAEIETGHIDVEVRWDDNADGTFPHIYGPIPVTAVVGTTPWIDWRPTPR